MMHKTISVKCKIYKILIPDIQNNISEIQALSCFSG